MRTAHLLALLALVTTPAASCADLVDADGGSDTVTVAEPDRCRSGSATCGGAAAPGDSFDRKIGGRSRVHGLWLAEDGARIGGSYYVPSIDEEVHLELVRYGGRDWDLTLSSNGQSFLLVTRHAGEPEARVHHQVTSPPLSDPVADELISSAAELVGELGRRLPDALVDGEIPDLPRCGLRPEIEWPSGASGSGAGSIPGGERRFRAKLKLRDWCRPWR